MASRRAQHHYGFVLSILGHAAIVVALTFSIPVSGPRATTGPVVIPIETVMINEAAIDAEIARLDAEELRREQAEEDRRRQIQEEQEELVRIQRQREEEEERLEADRVRLQAEEQLARQREAEEQQRQEEERLRQEERLSQEELAKQRAEAERVAVEQAAEAERRRQQAETAARLAEVEAEVARSIAAEQADRQARSAGLRDQWARAISSRVELYWNKPPNAGAGLECVLEVTQLPNGEVVNATIDECSTDDQTIIRSIENAVLNASPLPEPPRGVAFERVVRITFRPTE